jgi:uncharacterized protein YqeY
VPELSEEQARALADEFLKAAEAVADFRYAKRTELSDREDLELRGLEQTLSDLSDDFTVAAIELTLDSLKQTVDQMVKTTGEARAAIAKLDDVRKIVSVAANLVALGQAVTAGNAEGVLSCLQSTKESITG